MNTNDNELGKLAYDAYCGARDWLGFAGQPLPQWEEVKPEIQAGWVVSAKTIADHFRNAKSPLHKPQVCQTQS